MYKYTMPIAEDAFIIRGGRILSGNVRLSGAKNVALKVVIAALLFDQEVHFTNIPRISDVLELLDLICELGGKASFNGSNSVVIDGREMKLNRVDLLHASKIRVSFMLFAPLLNKFKSCFVPNPGGCRIGARPIDRIVEGMKKLGVAISYDPDTGYYEARVDEKPNGRYSFPKPSHTGTELLILLSVLGNKQTVLENTALEPEIDELINFLNNSGAHIRRDGQRINIQAVQELHQKETFDIPPDRNEAVTFASLALASQGDITIYPISPTLLSSFIHKVKEAGGGYEEKGNRLRFYYKGPLKATRIETSPHPGFMTDWQPNWAVLMTQAVGESFLTERVFENRFAYVEELRKLGAEIDYIKTPLVNPAEYFFFNFDPSKKYNQAIRIKGPQQLHGGALQITDLRAGATLAIAAFVAEGESVITNASILERGYENFVEKVKALGGDITKV